MLKRVMLMGWIALSAGGWTSLAGADEGLWMPEEQLSCLVRGWIGGEPRDCRIVATRCMYSDSREWLEGDGGCAAISVTCDDGFELSDTAADVFSGRGKNVIHAVQATLRESRDAVLTLEETALSRVYDADLHTVYNEGEDTGYYRGRCTLSPPQDGIAP